MSSPPLIGVTGWRETIQIDCGPYLTLALESHYADLVDEACGMPVVIAGGDSTAEAVVERMDGLLITGGPDVDPAIYGHERHPRTGAPDHQRDALEVALVQAALRRGMPVLAICRGCQLVAAALGGATAFNDLI